MKSKPEYSLVIVEPSVILTEGFRQVLKDFPEFEILSCFVDFESFAERASELQPDIVLVNPLLVSAHKVFQIRQLLKNSKETTWLAILYSYVPSETVSGFDGTIEVLDKPDILVKKIQAAVDSAVQLRDITASDSVDLSDREKEILIEVARGLTNKEIADQFNISIHTVITHRKNISRKTGIKTISGLTVYAMLNHLI